jgi:SAM-dependent methyltransferase
MTWTSGYVSEIDYTHGYYRELSPVHLSLALLLREQAAITGPLRYLELGFGQGLSLNVHAAAVPGEYWGTDFNPTHAANAAGLAAASQADLRVFDNSFEELAKREDLPDFDVIALHGIWSWISDENRRVIVDIARRKLKVGGVFYISYNTMPGWSASMPLRDLLMMHADLASGEAQGILPRIDAALAFGQRLVDARALYFSANPGATERLKAMTGQDKKYLAHEYFNADWHPMSFSAAAKYLDDAKLSFAASANLNDNLENINLTPDQSKIVKEIGHPVLRESVRDYCVNQQFRRDVWVKGRRKLAGRQQFEALSKQRLVLLTPADEVPLKVQGAMGEGNLQTSIYKPIIDFLASDGYAPKRVSDMVASGVLKPELINEVVTVLCGSGHAAPAQEPEAVDVAKSRTTRLNQHICDVTVAGAGEIFVAASPVAGVSVPMSPTHQLFLKSIAAGSRTPEEWARDAWAVYTKLGRRLLKDGKPVETEEENVAFLVEQGREFAEKRVPLLKAHGIL